MSRNILLAVGRRMLMCLVALSGILWLRPPTLLVAAERPDNLRFVAPQTVALFWVRPQMISQIPECKRLVPLLVEATEIRRQSGIVFDDIDVVQSMIVPQTTGTGEEKRTLSDNIHIFTLTTPQARTTMQGKMTTKKFETRSQDGLTFQFQDRYKDDSAEVADDPDLSAEEKEARAARNVEYRKEYAGRGEVLYKIDDRTLLSCSWIKSLLETPGIKNTKATGPIWGQEFTKIADQPFIMAINLQQIREMANSEQRQKRIGEIEQTIFNIFAPLWTKGDYAVFHGSIANGMVTLSGMADCPTEASAKHLAGTVEGVRSIAKIYIPFVRRMMAAYKPSDQEEASDRGFQLLDQFLERAQLTQSGKQVHVHFSINAREAAETLERMLVLTIESRDRSRREQDRQHIKQIGEAISAYETAHNSLPAAVMLGPDGKTTHSWRVAILPYIGEEDLYKQYKLDEPWDSKTNQKVLAKMPYVYRNFSRSYEDSNAGYFALTGAEGIFNTTPAKEGMPLSQIADGVAKTAMLVAADRDIPWTKPDDIPIVKGKMPELGTEGQPTFVVGFADNSTSTWKKKYDQELLWKFFTRDGGETVDQEAADIIDQKSDELLQD